MKATINTVELSKLQFGQDAPGGAVNARTTERENGITQLAQSILSEGLLVPLTVWETGVGIFVVDGNRRLAALKELARDGKLQADEPIEIKRVEAESAAAAREKSLATHVFHVPLHPIDRYEAFASLAADGVTVDDIADRFSMKRKDVERTLALGALAPEIRNAWRSGKLNEEAARAFTITPDHERQQKVFASLRKSGRLWAYEIRSALAGVEATAGLKFVGKADYESAGGRVMHDLFGEGVYVNDPALLQQMVQSRIAEQCAKLVEQGWGWAKPESEIAGGIYSLMRHADGRTLPKKDRPKFGCAVSVRRDGTLEITYGLRERSEKSERASSKSKTTGKPKDPNELSAALQMRLRIALYDGTRDALFDLAERKGEKVEWALVAQLANMLGEIIKVGHNQAGFVGSILEEGLPLVRKHMPAAIVNEAMVEAFNPEEFFTTGLARMLIEHAIKEMGGEALANAKKAELIDQAIKLAGETGWLPPELRTPHYVGPQKGKRAAAKQKRSKR